MKYTHLDIKMSIETPIYNELMNKHDYIENAIEEVLKKNFNERANKSLSSRNIDGILIRTYNGYKGDKNYTKDEFIHFMQCYKKFTKLFKKYKKSGFNKKLMPSFIMHPNLNDVQVMTYKERLVIANNLRQKTKLDKS